MKDQFWLMFIGVMTLFVGLWKVFQPIWWVQLRRRHPGYDKLDLCAFLYKGNRAEKTVRRNGYALIVVGVALLILVIQHF
jgi:uncharacterized membrane protein HdeD (DUF308 family)